MDIAPYINDATDLRVMLLGRNTGPNAAYGFGDREFLLKETKMLHYDHTPGHIVYNSGTLPMLRFLSLD